MSRWFRERRTWLPDVLVVLVLLPYALLTLPYRTDAPGTNFLLALLTGALIGTFLLRRLHRWVTLGVMLVLAWAQLLIGPEAALIGADLVLLFAVHGLASRHRWSRSIWAAIAVLVWLPVAAVSLMGLGWLNPGQVLLLGIVVAWMWTWGTLVRVRREHVASVQERADQLERETEALAAVAVARERARIAREIHDIVAHGLGVVVVLSDGAADTIDTEPERSRQAMLTDRDRARHRVRGTDDLPGDARRTVRRLDARCPARHQRSRSGPRAAGRDRTGNPRRASGPVARSDGSGRCRCGGRADRWRDRRARSSS
ncbi:histidine kinase dimerization/phosphoacceptor domain-containing protein [Propionibacteriaceae bacterium Y1700]|uniref:histidine kinase dimerization/phosphoacceptor domain-containing protein n=1 Tax=Microlunatus sp. Y1700 TaxID=3418487 RepID=UPI003DA712FD